MYCKCDCGCGEECSGGDICRDCEKDCRQCSHCPTTLGLLVHHKHGLLCATCNQLEEQWEKGQADLLASVKREYEEDYEDHYDPRNDADWDLG